MAIRTNKKKHTAVISGDMTIYTAAEYQQALIDACPVGKKMKLDLSEVEEIDTSGIQVLLALQHHSSGSAEGLQLDAASDVVNNVLALTRLNSVQKEQLS